jgi:uncharacterized membrane protein
MASLTTAFLFSARRRVILIAKLENKVFLYKCCGVLGLLGAVVFGVVLLLACYMSQMLWAALMLLLFMGFIVFGFLSMNKAFDVEDKVNRSFARRVFMREYREKRGGSVRYVKQRGK